MNRRATDATRPFMRLDAEAFGKPVPRLGLASRGGTKLGPADFFYAVECGVRFLNWPALAEKDRTYRDSFSKAVASLGSLREEVVVCAQFGSRTALEARGELKALLEALSTDYVDVLTLYYVEQMAEWEGLLSPGGALEFLKTAKRDGLVRRIGVTTHQRGLASQMALSGEIDALMIRYNAAHRGAERDVFPVTRQLGLPVIGYTATRWGELLRATPADPPGYEVPCAPEWYRYVLQQRAVSVVLCAPHDRAQLEEDLTVLAAEGPLSADEHNRLSEHGERVRRSAGRFR